MQGADMVHTAHMFDEIMLPYAGIIRIRFMGMISATVTRAPLQIFCKDKQKYRLISRINYIIPFSRSHLA